MTEYQTPPAITVHWLEKSRSQRVVWLLEECQVPYHIKVYKRVNNEAPPEMKKIHPLGKAPIVTVERPFAEKTLVLAESGAIFEYLVDHYAPSLAPPRYHTKADAEKQLETDSFLRYREFMHYSEGSLMSLLMRKHMGHSGGPEIPATAKVDRDIKLHLSFLEKQIFTAPDGGAFLCGAVLTAADIMMAFPLMVIQSLPGGLDNCPSLQAYVDRLAKLPSYEAAVKRIEQDSGERYALV